MVIDKGIKVIVSLTNCSLFMNFCCVCEKESAIKINNHHYCSSSCYMHHNINTKGVVIDWDINIHNIDTRKRSYNNVSIHEAVQAIKIFNVNTNILPIERLRVGMNVELEHDGREGRMTDVTQGKLLDAARIALAHFNENPGGHSIHDPKYGDYYHYLEVMEQVNKKYWACNRTSKPSIYL